ncbi:uncharacterized protein LOC107208022 [Parus major]|uniref:uncharacterized protein LOC107208022 n=1 Tax=Parus major TaxID=9157 RepID=UPI000771472A|nr:uncharacterized protein LOC107208022 [Parus major]
MRRRAAAGERDPPRQRRCPRSLGRGGGGEERRRSQPQLRLAREGEPRRRLGEGRVRLERRGRDGSGCPGAPSGRGAKVSRPERPRGRRLVCYSLTRRRRGPGAPCPAGCEASPPPQLAESRPGAAGTRLAPTSASTARTQRRKQRFLYCLHHSSVCKSQIEMLGKAGMAKTVGFCFTNTATALTNLLLFCGLRCCLTEKKKLPETKTTLNLISNSAVVFH